MTPYEKSPTSDSSIAEEYLGSGERLFNDRDPHYGLLREKPEHRIVIFWKAQGLSNKEIAQKTGYTTVSISNILRQPWARARLVEEIRKHSEDADVAGELLQGEIVNNLQALIDERENRENSASERISAAKELLDRAWGKPTQRIESQTTTVSLKTIEDLAREEERLAAQEARLFGKAKN